MTIFVVGTILANPEKREALMQLWRKFFAYMKEKPELFKEVKSFRVFNHMFGGLLNGFIEFVEYDSLKDYEAFQERVSKDPEFVKIIQEFLQLADPATLSEQVWKPVMQA